IEVPHQSLPDLAREDPPDSVQTLIGDYLNRARLMGQRTAELHLALARDADNPNFAPVPFSSLHQRSIYQSMRGRCRRVIRHLRHRLDSLPEPVQPQARELVDRVDEVLLRFRSLLEFKIAAQKLRIHGDFHLGQLLCTETDYVIIDFEGESHRPISERRLKRSPLRDVAGLMNSFHYAASAGLTGSEHNHPNQPPLFRSEDVSRLDPWCRFWTQWVSAVCLRHYLEVASEGTFLPRPPEDLARLLNAYHLEKALESLGYELDHRPGWVWIPIRSILQILNM
ncbi:MAG TPA: phosphotransferase, partial [Isosphaeraceae bacterium]|nr:phosphotransferase [Isosphaeraceae bacterium]